jgi:hypothetical protein
MSREAFTRVVDAVAKPLEDVLPEALKEHSATVVLAAGGGLALLTARAVLRNFYKSNPFNFGRTGALSTDEINSSIVNYEKFFDQKDGKGINDGQVAGKAKSNTPEFVDKFYRRVPLAPLDGGGGHAAWQPFFVCAVSWTWRHRRASHARLGTRLPATPATRRGRAVRHAARRCHAARLPPAGALRRVATAPAAGSHSAAAAGNGAAPLSAAGG